VRRFFIAAAAEVIFANYEKVYRQRRHLSEVDRSIDLPLSNGAAKSLPSG
jgi:hypothetical protein